MASANAATHRISIGVAMDEIYVRQGWYWKEASHPQLGNVTGRWASQGTQLRLPVIPGTTNRVTMHAWMCQDTDQMLTCYVNDAIAAELPHSPESIYAFDIGPELIGSDTWAVLKLETAVATPKTPGDARDLRIFVSSVTITADPEARDSSRRAKAEAVREAPHVFRDRAPEQWRTLYDPNNQDEYLPQNVRAMDYDDSPFDLVPTSHSPALRRGDTQLYRAWVIIKDNLDSVRQTLRLPGDEFENGGHRWAWVNEVPVPDGPGSLEDRTRKMLAKGGHLIVVKAMKGPLPRVEGDAIVEQPVFTGTWTPEKVSVSVGPLARLGEASKISVKLVSPSGNVIEPDGEAETEWPLSEYGEHRLVVEDDRGRRQSFPVHFLGIHFFHWGWYSAANGARWNGFHPGSNEFLDQLFSRLDDWGRPHHSITWNGTILDPGTGFHKTTEIDYIGKFKEAIAEGKLGFVGAPFPPRNICTDFGETLIRSMRYSLALHQSQFGMRPHHFSSHDAIMTPMLPQIMKLCGYDAYAISENWWGMYGSIPNSRDCVWRNLDGTTIRVLDSWYHAVTVATAARRAVEQGKPAVMCNEEFACGDPTGFLDASEVQTLASEGIFVQPVSLDEYQRITDDFARELTYEGDEGLCYKGWTGGAEGEVEYEKVNRLLETRLVALENVVAFARWLGFDIEQKPIDEKWNLSLRAHECHFHWGNGYPDKTQAMREALAWTDSEMARIASLIASKTKTSGTKLAVFNPVGFERTGLTRFEAPEGVTGLADPAGRVYPVQPDPDSPNACLAALPELPSMGYRCYEMVVSKGAEGTAVSGPKSPDTGGEAICNSQVTVSLGRDGTIASVTDRATGEQLVGPSHQLYLARPESEVPDELLSIETNQLNLSYYAKPVSRDGWRVICQGPALSSAECELTSPDYPQLTITMRVSLVEGERQARVRLTMDFAEPATIMPRGTYAPCEGTYVPGVFVAFPMPEGAKPMADMAYCVTDGVVTSTNHETFLAIPFRNGTFNTLSLAGPNSGEYSVLTRGLPDFFAVTAPEPYLGMSLGVGPIKFPYHDSYVHEYALFAPSVDKRAETGPLAYRAAQSFLIDPVSVSVTDSDGPLPAEASLIAADGDCVIVTGAQMEDETLTFRVLNLSEAIVHTKLTGVANHDSRAVELPPQALREITLNP